LRLINDRLADSLFSRPRRDIDVPGAILIDLRDGFRGALNDAPH
jgi:hypothetical protein